VITFVSQQTNKVKKFCNLSKSLWRILININKIPHWKAEFDNKNNKIFVFVSQARRNVLIVSAIFLVLISTTVTCRPSTPKTSRLESIGFQKAYDTLPDDNRTENCNVDMDLNELCQRCEKISESKSGDVFAMCCSDEDHAQQFCRDYVFYGVTR
jgi:hypothetical protein